MRHSRLTTIKYKMTSLLYCCRKEHALFSNMNWVPDFCRFWELKKKNELRQVCVSGTVVEGVPHIRGSEKHVSGGLLQRST